MLFAVLGVEDDPDQREKVHLRLAEAIDALDESEAAEVEAYSLSACSWYDVPRSHRPPWAVNDCDGDVTDDDDMVYCTEHREAYGAR